MSQQDVLGALQLLAAMYPLDGELVLPSAAQQALDAAEAGDEPQLPAETEAVVRVPLSDAEDAARVEVVITLCRNTRVTVRQPDSFSRAAYEELLAALPPTEPGMAASDVAIAAIEAVQAAAPRLVIQTPLEKEATPEAEDDGRLERVWFWFPSLSTKEKRLDMVAYAPRYRLAGFVLAGKPALLCLEGGGRAVDRYMAAIKSESWSDIPSFQKKVTERLRNPLQESERKFTAMTDITSLIPHYGTYNHRGDMGEVRRLMEEWGVGEDFGAAVLNSR